MTVCGNKMTGVCVMGKCPYVKVCSPAEWDKSESEPMTNEEWLKSLSTEELAEWFLEHMDCIGCPANCEKCYRYYDACKETIFEWLKEKHE